MSRIAGVFSALKDQGRSALIPFVTAGDPRLETTLPLMHALVEAMANDFEDRARQSRLLAAPKWGNDDPRADRWARALVEMRERVLDEVDAAYGYPPHVVCHVVRSLHYLDGQRIAASPDGRRAWTPVADSIGALTGTARRGPSRSAGSPGTSGPPASRSAA